MPLSTSESWYLREIVPDALTAFGHRLCAFYGVAATNFGSKGNEVHLRGRHRSMEWCLNSVYCTDPSYGTTDARDKRGNPRHIRAFDFQFPTDAEFHAAMHRLDTAVRAGLLPELAEWFGTFDGVHVVGWFEGHPGTADSSHLEHMHGGMWTEHADDAAFYDRLFNIITGGDMEQGDKLVKATGYANRTVGDHFGDIQNERNWWYALPGETTVSPPPPGSRADQLLKDVAAIKTAAAQILAALAGGTPAPGGGATVEQVTEIVHDELGKLEITVKD